MIKLEFNGKPFNPKTFEEAILKAAMEAAAGQLQEKIGAIRHPETGEFPTVVVSGTSLDNMSLRVEGSPELLAIVKERMALEPDNAPDAKSYATDTPTPKVFLSYAWEDRELASKVAHQLQSNGIDTWWAGWSLSAGDSLRQKIDEGLDDCTHFVVLLTSNSIQKPWVNQEMDAGLMLKLQSQVKFIALRHQLTAEQLPPLLRGLLAPSIENPEQDISQLINDIYGVTKKPSLGSPPAVISDSKAIATGYSAAATAIARTLVEKTMHARKFDPQLSIEDLKSSTGLSDDDVIDGLHELHGMVTLHFSERVWPEDELFATFDHFWMGWNPAEDALKLATDMLNDDDFPTSPSVIAERYDWAPRRLNPAMAYLINRKLVRDLKAMDGSNWLTVRIQKTDATRRFVRSRS